MKNTTTKNSLREGEGIMEAAHIPTASSNESHSQHTPGPWRVDGSTGIRQWDIVGPNGEDLAYVNISDGADEPTAYPVEANARLIAAAPELLAALKKAVDVIYTWHSIHDVDDTAWNIYREHAPEMKAINAALAKAEPARVLKGV